MTSLNIMVFSSVLCHFEVKSKFKPESRTYTTELGKHFLNTLGCRVALKHWPAFAHRIPIQCQCAIRLQLTPKSADRKRVCCFPPQQTRRASRKPSIAKIRLSLPQFAFTFPLYNVCHLSCPCWGQHTSVCFLSV